VVDTVPYFKSLIRTYFGLFWAGYALTASVQLIAWLGVLLTNFNQKDMQKS